MKPAALPALLYVGFLAAASAWTAAAQSMEDANAVAPYGFAFPSEFSTNAFHFTLPSRRALGSSTNFVFRTPAPATRRIPPNLQLSQCSTNRLQPGVYESWPYRCIVTVPGPQADDKCIIGRAGAGRDIEMPTAKPELWLVPRNKK